MQKSSAILVPGRDARSRYCAETLRRNGCSVADCPVDEADVVVLPMRTQLPPELLEALRPGQWVLARGSEEYAGGAGRACL